jgi:hypothetical protein
MIRDAAKLQDRLESSRARFLAAIETLPDEALLSVGAIGPHSVADLLARSTSWEAELVTALMRLNQGKKPGKLLAALAKPDAYNAKRLGENQDRDLNLIFQDFQRVRMQLETWLEEFSDKELTDPNRFKWLRGKSLAQLIADITYGTEEAYVSEVESFAQVWNRTDSGS